jgi:hypothetical protein
MQIINKTISGQKVVFESVIEEVPGGCGLNVARLDYAKVDASLGVDKRYIAAGTPVYYALTTRVAEICKSATAIDGGAATAPRVQKEHHFKVGDFLNDGTTGAIISAIDTTVAAYDTLTVNTAVTYAAGTKFLEGTVTGTSAALKYTPNGLLKDNVFIGNGNADASIVTIGSVREAALTYPLPDLYKTALRGTMSLITIV